MFDAIRANLMNRAIQIGGAILVVAILVGQIALPIFFTVNTTTWGATNIVIWGVVVTVGLAAIIMGFVGFFKKNNVRAD